MRSLISGVLLLVLALGSNATKAGEAKVQSLCAAPSSPCACAPHARDCLPVCHIEARVTCEGAA